MKTSYILYVYDFYVDILVKRQSLVLALQFLN